MSTTRAAMLTAVFILRILPSARTASMEAITTVTAFPVLCGEVVKMRFPAHAYRY